MEVMLSRFLQDGRRAVMVRFVGVEEGSSREVGRMIGVREVAGLKGMGG